MLMLQIFKFNQKLFALIYHQRSNSESVFSMLKRKFGFFVRSKIFIAQENEILTKICCHNACVLAEALLEFNLQVPFMVN